MRILRGMLSSTLTIIDCTKLIFREFSNVHKSRQMSITCHLGCGRLVVVGGNGFCASSLRPQDDPLTALSVSITMRNVEIKAKITDYDNICKIAEELSGGPATVIRQDDTFYKVHEGRLKMRFYADSSATLVRYDRPDEEGPKLSNYELLDFSINESHKAKLLDEMLKKCLGIYGRIVKERKLFLVDQTRIHIDTVQDLGNYMELEVVLRPEQTLQEGQAIARDLQTKLGVKDEDLIDCAYVNLLDKKKN